MSMKFLPLQCIKKATVFITVKIRSNYSNEILIMNIGVFNYTSQCAQNYFLPDNRTTGFQFTSQIARIMSLCFYRKVVALRFSVCIRALSRRGFTSEKCLVKHRIPAECRVEAI